MAQEIDLSQVTPDIKKILLIGQEGTGKTHFIGTMPKPIYLFSFDKGYQTLAGEKGITVFLAMDDDRYRPKAWKEFKQQFDRMKRGELKYKDPQTGEEQPYRTIAIDSITALSKFLFDHEQYMANNIDKSGGFTSYLNVKSKLQDVVTTCVYLAEYVVVTALIESERDENTGELFFVPSTEGKFRNEMGQWFDAVFFMQVDKNPSTGNKVFKMMLVGDKRYRAKIRVPSSIGGVVGAVEEPDFNKLKQKIEEAYHKVSEEKQEREAVKK